MKFVRRDLGEAAEASSGGGEAGLGREILLMGGALLGLILGLWFGVAWITELTLPLISPGTEHKWFGNFSPSQARAEATLTGPQKAGRARVAAVLARLAADPSVPRVDYRIVLIPGSEPNAFAFPGGAIGVTEGLLDIVDEDVPLAFVLGHELGHFAQRDHLRGIGRQLGRQLVWALIFGEGGDLLSSQLPALLDLRHSRSQESGADLFGLELVHRTYGTTAGTERLFAWLEARDRNPRWLEMLQTHPLPANRLAEMRLHASRLTAPPQR
jgi:Zn-dependent protease with chaperone function